jgi:hypothetical protein
MPITFVYRSHYEGLLSKHLVRFPDDSSVLAWFQRVWPAAREAADVHDFLEEMLGGSVYGFSTIFEAAREHKLPPPRSLKGLKALLDKHLYVEGDLRLDARSLRVLTDDDEVNLAYFFFDDAADPDRVAYLLQPDFPLPHGAARAASFVSPVAGRPLGPAGQGPGRTWAVLLTFYDSDSFPDEAPGYFEGVRLPELLDHLRATIPEGGENPREKYPATWPLELRLLRAAIEPGDRDLEPALRRCASYPLWTVGSESGCGRAGLGPQKKAWAKFKKLAQGKEPDGDPSQSHIRVAPHIAQAALHASQAFGYQQWFLFDDLWASAHPALASSLLRYAAGWDPWTDDEAPGSG